MQIWRLGGCENFVGKTEELVFNAIFTKIKVNNKQAIYINSTDYSVDSQPNYRHLYYILRYPLLSFNTHEWYRTFKNVSYAAPANGDFCLWSSYIFHIVHKSLLFKFCIGSIKHCSTSLLGLLVKCGTAECGMRKVKCGMETVEDGVEYAFVIYVSRVIFKSPELTD